MTTGRLAIVVGKAASGKTTLCKSLADFGFNYVSASDVLRSVYGGSDQDHDRRSLAEHGDLARGTPSLEKFHNALMQRITNTACDVVVDGPRFIETVEIIRSLSANSILAYLDCPDELRRQRLIMEGRSSDWAWLARHPTETSVTEMREVADIVLDGSQAARSVLQSLKAKMQQTQPRSSS